MSQTEEKREGFYLSEDGEWIPDGWIKTPLNQVVSDFIDYRGKTPTKTTSGIPLITAKIVKDGRVLPTQEYIAEDDYDSWMRRGIPNEGDVILTTEAPLGEVALIPIGKVALAQRIITLRGKKSILNNGYLKYSLQSPLMQHRLVARESGSTVSGIKSSELKVTKLLLPKDIIEQKAIASVLGSLDDKIELLREQNETLEALAQTLFKRWFIDFNFPDENGNPYKDSGGTMIPSELGEIPEGWRDHGLTNYLDVMGGGTPKTSVSEYWNGDYYFYTPKDAKGGFYCDSTEKSVTQLGIDNSSTKLFPENTIFVTARGTVGKTSLALLPMTMNQSCYALKEKNGHNYTGFLLLREAIHKLQKYATGGVFDAITTSTLESTVMAYPSEKLVKLFEGIISSSFHEIKSNTQQIKTLTHLRDTLLPKLMKGEIRI